jgi:hypothetical protein
MPAIPERFTIAMPDDVLRGLHQRLALIRWPDDILGTGWHYGILAISYQLFAPHDRVPL